MFFRFSAPPDALLDRDGYFERCRPGAGTHLPFDFKRLIEHGDEVIATYERTREDGDRGRNTDILTFAGDKLVRSEVYFGWNRRGARLCQGSTTANALRRSAASRS